MNIRQHSKGSLQQEYSKHQSKWREIKRISTKIKSKTRMYISSIPIQYSTWNINQRNKTTEGDQENRIRKGRVKVSLFADHIILHIKDLENPQETSTTDRHFHKIARYKINTKISVTFLDRNDKRIEKEIRETVSLTIAENIHCDN